jgi:hypothetical protein
MEQEREQQEQEREQQEQGGAEPSSHETAGQFPADEVRDTHEQQQPEQQPEPPPSE